MIDILFTHSYFLRFDPKEFRAMMPYPPLGTLYAASLVRTNGYTVGLFDSMLAYDENEITDVLKREKPRVVVIYDDDFNYLTKMCLTRMREAAFVLARLAKDAGCVVVVHGSDPGDHLQKYFTHSTDFVLCGEGEQTLVELLDAILRGQGSIDSINGLAFLKAGGIVRTAARPPQRNLDALPFPAWDLVDIDRYRNAWESRHGYFSLNMVTTRGCPFHCNWCAKPVYGQVYNSRSPQNVVREMRFLLDNYHPDHLWFCDDIFGLTPGWVRAFSEEVQRQDASIPFKCLARVDLLLKEDTIANLRRAGCVTVWVGAESGSQRILDAMEKGTTVSQIYQATAKLKEAGIRVGFFIQYGYPGETRADIELTLKMLKECRPDEIGISVSYPLPGTKFHARVQEQLREKHNWVDSQDLDLMFRGTFVPDFYRMLHTVTHKRLRVWQGVATLRRTATRPWTLRAISLRGIAASAYHMLTLPRLERELNLLSRL